MKKIIALMILGAILTPVVGLAQGTLPEAITQVFTNIKEGLIALLAVVAAIAIIVAGYLFLTAGGDPNKVKMAQQAVLFALVGVMVALLAETLVTMVQGWVEGGG